MSQNLTAKQLELVEKISKENGFNNYFLETSTTASKGDGYLSEIKRIKIVDKLKNATLQLILKCAAENKSFRESAAIRQSFVREITVYETLFKIYDEFLLENNVPKLFNVPKFFGCIREEPEECLVLEDITPLSYKLWSRKKPINMQHTKLVFEKYAKFHAISYALRKNRPEKYEVLKEIYGKLDFPDSEDNKKIFGDFIRKSFERGCNAVKHDDKVLKKVQEYQQTEANTLYMELLTKPNEFSALIHGDCWTANMMFKYTTESSTPEDVCLLDWQLVKLASPVLDLCNFLYVCCPKEVFQEYETLLKHYHRHLSETLLNFGCNASELYPLELLFAQWKRYSKVGFNLALMFIRMMLSDDDEIPDMVESAAQGDNFLQSIDFDTRNLEAYNQRIYDLARFLVEFELF